MRSHRGAGESGHAPACGACSRGSAVHLHCDAIGLPQGGWSYLLSFASIVFDALCVVLPAPIGYYLEPGFVFYVCESLSSHRRGAGVCPEEPRTLGSSAHFSVSSPSRFLLDASVSRYGFQPARARVCPEEPRVTQLFQPSLLYCSPARIHCSSSLILLPVAQVLRFCCPLPKFFDLTVASAQKSVGPPTRPCEWDRDAALVEAASPLRRGA